MNQQIRLEGVSQAAPRGSAQIKFAVACLLFTVALTASAVFSKSANAGSIPYQVILFLMCSAPFFLGGGNPNHRLLAIFMACYYTIFGMASFLDIVTGQKSGFVLGETLHIQVSDQLLTKSDWVVIIGGIAFLCGYYVVNRLRGKKRFSALARDWKPNAILMIALIAWCIGLTFSFAYDMIVTTMHIPTHVLGVPLSIASHLKFFSPLAAMMFIYLAAKGYRPRLVWPLLLLIIFTEFVFGFLVNSKEVSYRIPVLLLLGMYYIKGSLNKKILIIAILSTIPYLLFFDIYRMDVLMGARNQTRVEALQNFGKNLELMLRNAGRVKDVSSSSLDGLKNRVNGKIYVDIIVNGTDFGKVDFRKGDTLFLLPQSFIPRMFWPEKPNISIGQLFNHEFQLSESKFTYVPTTQLGELYWNFGMTSVILGMMCIGMVFGYIASLSSVGMAMTLPKFLILMLATYYLAVSFEGNIANQYSVFIRLVILVALINGFVGVFGGHQRRVSQSDEK